MEPYKTQQTLMAKKAKERGILNSEITEHFQQKLSQVYEETPHCAESWALGRAEYFVWKHFFPDDPWPGTALNMAQFPLKTKRMSSESGEVIDTSPDKKDQSSLSSKAKAASSPEIKEAILPHKPKPTFSLNIEDALLNAAGNCNILVSYKEALDDMKERYPRESLEWQQWMSGNKVWMSNFRQNGVFPCNEPPRSYALLSSDNKPRTGFPRCDDQSRRWRSSGSSWRPEYDSSRRRSRSPPTGPRRSYESRRQGGTMRSGEVLERSRSQPSAYIPKESFMEKKAIKIGGDSLRHGFFRTLQESRDAVSKRHPGINRLHKHWLADKLTWERLFKNEPFPWLNNKPPGVPQLDEKPPVNSTGNISMGAPPSQSAMEFKATAQAGNNALAHSHRKQSRLPYNVPGNNFNQSRTSSSNNKNSFDLTARSCGSVIPSSSSPEMPGRLMAALPNKGVMERTSRMSVAPDSARLKGHVRTTSNTSNVQSGGGPVEGTKEVTIRKNAIFCALLGIWDESFKSVQRALGVTIEFSYNDGTPEHLKLTIEPYQPGDTAALERAHKFFELWKRMLYCDQLIKLEHFWNQFKTNIIKTPVHYQPMVHVNGKKIFCPGRFGDLCEFFSNEIQNFQTTMAEFTNTEDALACSTIFEAIPYNIYLSSYPLPVLFRVDSNTRNKILDQHDAFLEEWVRISIKNIKNPTSLWDMNSEYVRKREERLRGMDRDLDELVKEGAAKSNQKRKSKADEDDEHTGRLDKKPCL